MRYVAAYMLLSMGSKAKPGADDIMRVLDSVGVEGDKQKASKVVQLFATDDIDSLAAAGSLKLTSVSAAAPTTVVEEAVVAAPEVPVEVAKQEKSESESDDDMGMGLFD